MLIVQLENSHVTEVGHGFGEPVIERNLAGVELIKCRSTQCPASVKKGVRRGFEEAVLFGGYLVEQGSNRVGD